MRLLGWMLVIMVTGCDAVHSISANSSTYSDGVKEVFNSYD